MVLYILLLCLCASTLAEGSSAKLGLDLHNYYRGRHGSPPLRIDDRLMKLAQECANYYASIGRADHTCPYKNHIGENLGWKKGDEEEVVSPEDAVQTAVNDWYIEIRDYHYDDPGLFKKTTGHFTQLVWKSSLSMGIATSVSPETNFTFVCAMYDPPGNIAVKGKGDRYKIYKLNVLRPQRE